MNEVHLKALAFTDVFTLSASNNMDDAAKQALLEKMQAILLQDFLVADVPEILNEEQRNEIEKYIDENQAPAVILSKIKEFIPEVDEIMYEKSMEFKKIFAIKQIDQTIQILEKKLELAQNGETQDDQEQLRSEIEKLNQVLTHYQNEEWDSGVKLLAPHLIT